VPKEWATFQRRRSQASDGQSSLPIAGAANHSNQAESPTVDRDRLGYFALSVFWRASVHIWKQRDGASITIDLGKSYDESLRQFLLGQSALP
jgi:hypothetical protein